MKYKAPNYAAVSYLKGAGTIEPFTLSLWYAMMYCDVIINRVRHTMSPYSGKCP